MKQARVREIMEKCGAIITNSHIVYTSGKHGSAYVNKDDIYPHVAYVGELCRALGDWFVEDDVDAIIAPAIGGTILAPWTAFQMSAMLSREVLSLYAEKGPDDTFVIKCRYDLLIPKKRILVVEDVVTTGGSVRKVVNAVRALDGNVIGVSVICNRGGVDNAGVGNVSKLHSLIDVQMDAYEADECPLCKSGVPINTNVGKGAEFLAKLKQ